MAEAPAPLAAEAPAGGLKAKLPLIAAIVVGLAVGAGTGAAVVGPLVVSKLGMTQVPAKAEHVSGEPATDEHASTEPAAAGEHGDKAAAPPVLLLENLVLNPSGSGGSRYLLMSIAIECADAAGVAALTARDPELRDLVLTTLGHKSVEDLSDVTGRETIKTEIVTALNARFGKHSVKQLYFPQFVIQ